MTLRLRGFLKVLSFLAGTALLVLGSSPLVPLAPAAPKAEAATSGVMKLYLKKDPSDINATYNSLGLAPYTSSASSGATPSANGVAVGTSLCESDSATSETSNRIGVHASTLLTGDLCIASFISSPVGQSITIATGDTNALSGIIWGDSNAALGATLKAHLFKYSGGTLTIFGTLTADSAVTTSAQKTLTAANPTTGVTLAAGDRIVVIMSAAVTGGGNSWVSFDSEGSGWNSYVSLKYTLTSPNKPSLTGTRDDDFEVDKATTNCTSGGTTYNSKWTCLLGTAANIGGSLNSEDLSNGTVTGDSSSWLWLSNKTTSAASISNFGSTPSNTFLYQSLSSLGYGSGVVSTVINSSAAYTYVATNATSPYNHAGLVLWSSNTDYLEVQVYSDGAKSSANTVKVALNNSGTLSGATSLNPTTSTGTYNRVWVRFQYTSSSAASGSYQAQYSTDGSSWSNVGSPVTHGFFTRTGLNVLNTISASGSTNTYSAAFDYFQHTFTPPQFSLSKTAASVTSTIDSGTTSFRPNTTSCTSSATCAAFTGLLDVGTGSSLSSIKITEAGTASALNDLSNVVLYYDTDGNFSNGVTQYGATSTSFASGDTATFTQTLSISPGTTYFFYVKADLLNGTNNPAGGTTLSFSIANNADVVFADETSPINAAATLTGTTTVKPNVTNVTYPYSTDGGRVGQTISLSGFGFGTSCSVAGGSKVSIGSYDLSCTSASFTKTAISIPIDTGITAYGGTSANGLLVTIGSTADDSRFTFYIYPTINTISTPSISNAARESESVTLSNSTANAAKFGSTQGTIVFTGGFGSVSATITSWSDTSVTVTVPAAISNSIYTGDITLTRNSDSKPTNAYDSNGFRILPRITADTPNKGLGGETKIQLVGDHFCQTGTCPVSPNRSTATNKVTFGSTNAAESDFSSTSGGAGTCNGASAAWDHSEICVYVPADIPTVLTPTAQNIVVTSNSFTSASQGFTLLSQTPKDPTSLDQYSNSALTSSLSINQITNQNPLYFAANGVEVTDVSGGNLYLQVELKPVGTSFSCGTGACGGVSESSAVAGPGPTDCRTAGNNCSVSITPSSDNSYHWRMRVRHNRNGSDFFSNWVSFGGNSESAADFRYDVTPPAVTNVVATVPTTNSAIITWDTSGEGSSGRVQYNTTGTFVTNCATNNDCTSLLDQPPPGAFTHTVNFTNIDSGTTFYYRVRSQDEAGNETISTTRTFSTGSVIQPGKTVRFSITGQTGTLSPSSSVAPTFLISRPESGATVKSMYVELTGVLTTTTGTPTVTLQVNSETAKTYTLPTSAQTGIKIRHAVSEVNLSPTTNTLTITTASNTTFNITSADLYMTYAYTP